MKTEYIIVTTLILISASFFGAYFGSQKTIIVEKEVVKEVFVPVLETKKTVESITVSVPIPTVTPNKKFQGRWGGIASSSGVYPIGTTKNVSQSSLYRTTVTTGNGEWYIFWYGYWFDKTEYNALPYEVKIYRYSPYIWGD